MGDDSGSSSSRREETVVIDHGRRRSSCGYCRSPEYTSISHGLWAQSITANDYQELLDRGWRRSGSFVYKPEMERTCCPCYTIRLKAGDFVLSKEQARVLKKMQRFLGALDLEKPSASNGSPTSRVSNPSAKRTTNACDEDGYISLLSKKINDAVNACLGTRELFSCDQFPKAIVKKVKLSAKRKLAKKSEDLLYTSNISFQIASFLRKLHLTTESNANKDIECMDLSSNTVADKLACFMEQQGELSGLSIKACNGHLNFYASDNQIYLFDEPVSCKRSRKSSTCSELSAKDKHKVLEGQSELSKARTVEIRTRISSFDPEEYALFRKYQIKVHDDAPAKVTESSYRRFLVDTPLIFCPPGMSQQVPPCGFGSFHQQYLIDGKLVAVGVVDILPKCLSSKYLFWDPDYAFLSLGKYSALKEIEWVKMAQVHCSSLQYYYLGYYIQSCSKMRYKAAYHPSELLCPLRYQWVPFHVVKPLLDKKSYVILSDFANLKNEAIFCHQSALDPVGEPHNDTKQEGPSDSLTDDVYEMDYDSDDEFDSVDESCPETSGISSVNALHASGIIDISDIMIDLNGTRLRFKDLQKVFGSIDRRKMEMLEQQLHGYATAVGAGLATHMIYALQ